MHPLRAPCHARPGWRWLALLVLVLATLAPTVSRTLAAAGDGGRVQVCTPDGVRWDDGTTQHADVILWCTGFRSSLDHLAPLMLREASGGIVMTGRLATEVAKEPRVHLVGYGPSASTIGANRAGAAAADELLATLGLLAETGT